MLLFRSGHSLTEFTSDGRVERGKFHRSPPYPHRTRVSECKLCWYQRQHDQVPHFLPYCARCVASSLVSVFVFLVNLYLVEGWRSEPLQAAWCVSKSRKTVVTQSGSTAWVWPESRNREIASSLVCSELNTWMLAHQVNEAWVVRAQSPLA